MKPLAQRNKKELEELFEELDLPLPDGKYTKNDMLFNLEEAGVTNKNLESFKKKEASENTDISELESMVVVCMDRLNGLFQFKHYKFSQAKKYILMPKEDAEELLMKNHGFHKASKEEVKAYYS